MDVLTDAFAFLQQWLFESLVQPLSFALGQGHLLQQEPSWVSVHHDADHPSVVHLPVTSGNRIGTFMSGGTGAPRSGVAGAGSQGTGWDKW